MISKLRSFLDGNISMCLLYKPVLFEKGGSYVYMSL